MAARASSIDVRLRLRGQRQFKREVATSAASLEAMGLKGAKALGRFAMQGERLKQFGRTWSRNVTLPIVAGGALAVKAAIDWESAFAGVRKTVDATEGEFASLEGGLRQMSTEIPVAATELAGIAEAAGQLGIKTKSIESFTRVMADLGVATNLTSDEAATALARFANITQMPQRQFDRLGSTVVELGNNLATTEKEIVDMGLRIAGAGAQIGLTEPQIMSFAAGLSSVGIRAEAGGTAISKVFLEMLSAVKGGGKELREFADIAGLSSGKFASMFERDASGAAIQFIEGLGQIKKEGGDVSAALDDLGLSGIRVKDTLLRASGAGDLLREALGLGSSAWKENNALSKEARQRYKTVESQLKMLKNTVIDLGVTVGQELLPPLTDFAKFAGPKIASAARTFGQLPGPIKAAAVGALLLLASVGPVAWVLGNLANGIGRVLVATNWLITSWKTGSLMALRFNLALLRMRATMMAQAVATRVVTGAQWLLNAAMAANPVFLVVAAVAALAAGFILAYNNIGWFRDGVDAVWGVLKGVFGWIVDHWKLLAILLLGPVGIGIVSIVANFDRIKVAAEAVIGFIADHWRTIIRVIGGPWGWLAVFIIDHLEQIKDAVTGAFNWIVTAGQNTWGWLKTASSDAFNWVKGVVGGAVTWIRNHWKLLTMILLGPIGVAIVKIVENFNTIKAVVKSVFGFVKGVVDAVTGWVGRVFKARWKQAGEFIENPIAFAIKWVKNAFNNFISFVSALPGRLATAGRGAFNWLREAFRSALNWVIDRWNALEFRIPEIDLPGPGPKFGGQTIGVPDIPRLAKGGNVLSPGVAEVGDRGPEIVHLPRAARVEPLGDPTPIDLKGVIGGVKTVVVKPILDGKVIAESTAQVAEDEAALA